jgi:type I restriction enzyme R subunit
MQNSDKQNARIEHDKALNRVMIAVLKDDTELFKKFSDDDEFRRWLTDMVFSMTYDAPAPAAAGPAAPPAATSARTAAK